MLVRILLFVKPRHHKAFKSSTFFQIRGCHLGSPNAEKITFSELLEKSYLESKKNEH